MNVQEKLKLFLDSAGKNEGTALYRDPQEFMYMESRDNSSYVYAFGMSLFKSLTGTDYFEHIHIPDDEYFMTMDPESDGPVIKPENVPDCISDFADILGQMTMYKRKSRIPVKTALDILQHLYDPDTDIQTDKIEAISNQIQDDPEDPVVDAIIAEDPVIAHDIISDNTFCDTDDAFLNCEDFCIFPHIETGYDYGIILNNKRYGRIEFRCLYDCTLKQTGYIDIPVKNSGKFTIGISRRHKDYRHISNPSSVYGDNIIPCAVLQAHIGEYKKLRIEFDTREDQIKINIYGLDMNNNIISGNTPLLSEIKPV